MTTAQIASAVALDDDAAFKAVSGIGPKTAKLITVTLAGKLSHLVLVEHSEEVSGNGDLGSVVDALVSLGWPERSAQEAVKSVAFTLKKGEGREVALRLALSKLGASKSSAGAM
jgi:Holliday junction DNA helicase RuvA